jgi:short subunit fatty acids transporter
VTALGLAAIYLARAFARRGLGALDINTVNLAFFALGLVLHGACRSLIAPPPARATCTASWSSSRCTRAWAR